ncbi:hypothetical protein H4R99_005667 [Coemansia sp. RSA 1722]|nr:hypothetical protein IWW45_003917 [Coemansia sp. RSA 485]KAJ2594667.1 hypothetical protein H4R99_005667 [Coemansia sp. RSA 1722]
MPLFNGTAVKLVQGPQEDDGNNSKASSARVTRIPGWQIRFTGETFDDYEQYLERLAFYRTAQFTCTSTGQPGLTFEQAQLSERAAIHSATGIGFSDILVCEMLTFLSQSTLPISMAVDVLYYRFQYEFYPNEHIDVRYPGTDGAMYECFVVSIGPLPMGTISGVGESSTKIAIERLGQRAEEIIGYERRKLRLYTVRLYDMDGKPIDDSDISVRAEELSRSRNVFTKVALRQFLDENMARGPRPGSPWVVKPQWRERFRIPYLYGGEARLLRLPPPATATVTEAKGKATAGATKPAKSNSSSNKPVDPYADERMVSVKPVRKFPIDDLELCTMEHVKWNQGVVWALRNRRRHQKQQQTETGSRQITDFFSITKTTNNEAPALSSTNNDESETDQQDELAKYQWPTPLCEWQVPLPLVSRMLSTYMFVSCFGSCIKLTPYSLDFFESALVSETVSPVYSDTVAALLNVIVGDRSSSRTGTAKAQTRITAMIAAQDQAQNDVVEPSSNGDFLMLPPAPVFKTERSTGLRRSRVAVSSGLAHSSSVVGSPEDSDASDAGSDASTMAPGSPKKPTRGKRRTTNGRRSRVSVSRVVSESETEPETAAEPSTEDVRQMRGRALLRYLSRMWWRTPVDRDSWAAALVGWLVEASYEYPEDLSLIVEALWQSVDTLDTLSDTLWSVLSTSEHRLCVLELLVCECSGVDAIREYLDQTTEAAAELKRERIEVKRELRRLSEQLQGLDKADADEAQSLGMSREQGRKEKEAGLLRQKERRKLGEAERTQQRRLDNLERDLRRSAVGRLVPLGTDRFLTRYYFLDGVGDCPLAGSGSGRLLVQPAPMPEVTEAMQQVPGFVRAMRPLQMSWTWSGGESPRKYLRSDDEALGEISADALEGDREMARLAANGELWGYYATTRQVDSLRKWLESRGRRESALEQELDLVHLALAASIRKRCHTLDASFDARVNIRQNIVDRIAALVDENEDNSQTEVPGLAQLHMELAEIDRTPVPKPLLPPAMLVGESMGTSTGNNDAGSNANGSSRASSVEPGDLFAHQASMHASAKRQAGRRGRRARVHHRSANANHPKRPRTFIDDFLDYANTAE